MIRFHTFFWGLYLSLCIHILDSYSITGGRSNEAAWGFGSLSFYHGDTIVSMPTPFSKHNIPSGQTVDAVVRKTRTSPLFDMVSKEGWTSP